MNPNSAGHQGSRLVAFETTVAIRQLRAGRSGSLSVLTAIAVAGVVLAVAALVTVMSVTGGFQRLFREKVLGLNAHVLVMRYGLDFTEYREVMERALKVPGVLGASPFLFNEMMISAGDVLGGVMVKGIDPGSVDTVSDLRRYVQEGTLDALQPAGHGGLPPGVVLGRELATKLGVSVGDAVLLVSPLKGLDPTSFSSKDLAPTSSTFTVSGIYSSGFYEYDARLVFVHYRALQSFFRQPDSVTGVELKVDDIFATRSIARRVRVKLGDQRYSVAPWTGKQVELLERTMRQRDMVRWAISGVLLALIAASLTMLLLPTRRGRVLRGLGSALLLTAACAGLVGAWVGDWGAGLVRGPELGLAPHLRIQRDNGDFLEYRNALSEARSLPEVAQAGAYITGTARVLPRKSAGQPPPAASLPPATASPEPQAPGPEPPRVRLRGFDSESGGLPLGRYVVAGQLGYLVPPMLPSSSMPPYRVVLGEGLAQALGVKVGDVLRVQPEPLPGGSPQPDAGPYAMEVTALVRTGDPEADGQTIFLDFLAARRILTMVDAAEGVELWLRDPLDAPDVAAQMSSRLGGTSYRTLDWKEINHNIFRSLELQKQSLSLVLFVITVVAALNIISTLVLMVIDKGHQVAILKAMGATAGAIMRIFVVQGFFIGLVGTSAGLALGYGACHLLARIRFPLQADVYLIGYLPVDISGRDFLVAAVAALLVSLWATIYPSIRAAALPPVEGMRQV